MPNRIPECIQSLIRPRFFKKIALRSYWPGLLAFFGTLLASPLPQAIAQPSAAVFNRYETCPFDGADEIPEERLICGQLSVPEDRSDAQSPLVSLPVIILKAQSGASTAEPLVFLHGGPGGGPVGSARSLHLFSQIPFGRNRDIILYNQRGGLLGNPVLACAETGDAGYHLMASDISYDKFNLARAKGATACLDSLRREGAVIETYGGLAHALDLKDMRLALGIEKWALFGISYGTHVAQNALKVDRQALTRLLLDSPVILDAPIFFEDGPGNLARALGALFKVCRDTSCNESFPDIERTFISLMEKLHKNPALVHLSSRSVEGGGDFAVNWYDFAHLVHWMLYNPATLEMIPLLISETAKGNTTLLKQTIEQTVPTPKNPRPFAGGGFVATACADRPQAARSSDDDELVESMFGEQYSIAHFLNNICGPGTPVEPLTTPVHIPALALSGVFDPITPSRYVAGLKNSLPELVHLVSPATGHAVLGAGRDCALGIASHFLDTGETPGDVTCLTEDTPDFQTELPKSQPFAITAENIEEWADSTFEGLVTDKRISGAVVSVVHKRKIIFARGYGLGNAETGAPVTPDRTRFLIGSTTKTFTATLIARLVDEGLIASIDDPANLYLKRIQLPDNDGTAITIRHLATHTAGFEDKFSGISSRRPISLPASPETLNAVRPAYVRAAGNHVVYSNFGIAILGALIEDVTGKPITQAMKSELFLPLNMNNTELAVSVTRPDGMGIPVMFSPDGTTKPLPYHAISPVIAPAGAIVTTGQDMARYMNAQLSGDQISDTMRNLLHHRQAQNAPQVNGLGLAFFIGEWNKEKVVGHGGNWPGFHTWMTLLPEQDAGVFISLMGAPAPQSLSEQIAALWQKPNTTPPLVTSAAGLNNDFLIRFLGERTQEAPDKSITSVHEYAGTYRPDRRNFEDAEALVDLLTFGATLVRVQPGGGNTLVISGEAGWQPVAPGVFQLNSPAAPYKVFRKDMGQSMTMIPDIGIYTFSRISWWQNPRLHAFLALGGWGFALAGGLAAGLRLARGTSVTRGAIAATATGFLALLLPILIFAGFETGQTVIHQVYRGEQGRMLVLVITANLMTAAALWGLVELALVRRRTGHTERRALIATLGGLILGLMLALYNVAGWHLP